jgi:hypothetical protein
LGVPGAARPAFRVCSFSMSGTSSIGARTIEGRSSPPPPFFGSARTIEGRSSPTTFFGSPFLEKVTMVR